MPHFLDLLVKISKLILKDVVIPMKGCSFSTDFAVLKINSHTELSEMPLF